MKVYIGPFKSWIGPYQIADLLQKVGVSEDRCHEIGGWLAGGDGKDSILMRLCNWWESKKKRKIKVKIHNYDTWSMDVTLSMIILPMLKQLKDTKHGAPGDLEPFQQTSNQGQGTLEFYAEDDNKAWEKGHDQWEEILDKMIWSFEQIHPDHDWEKQFHSGETDFTFVTDPERPEFSTMEKGPKHTHKFDVEGYTKHSARIDEGLELFGKYYRALWD